MNSNIMPSAAAHYPNLQFRRAQMSRLNVRLAASLGVLLCSLPSSAQDWYPKDCCPDYACEPVKSFKWLRSKGGNTPLLSVQSRYGPIILQRDFPFRMSKDGRVHICVMYDAFGNLKVNCLFLPPIM